MQEAYPPLRRRIRHGRDLEDDIETSNCRRARIVSRAWRARGRRTAARACVRTRAAITGIAFTTTVVGVGTGLLPPSFTVDVVANLAFGLPVIVLPLVYFWAGRGEQRSRPQSRPPS